MSELIVIPGGTFLMGENDNDKFANDTERPSHEVHVPSFRLAPFPVTIAEFRELRPNHEAGLPEKWPATMISWNEAIAYCSWLGGGARLPTEAEWEYAARAGSTTPYPWGEEISPHLANYYYNEQGSKVGPGHRTPTGEYSANAFRISDMLGNVCEWTLDAWHPNYDEAPEDASARPPVSEPANRVLRGGAWDYLPRLLRVSWRDRLPQDQRRDNLGFRIASNL